MAKKLTPDEVEKFRQLLIRIRREISGDIDGLEADAFQTDGERPPSDSPADVGSDSFAQQFSLELLARDERTLFEVDEAIDRVNGGVFGRCPFCVVVTLMW